MAQGGTEPFCWRARVRHDDGCEEAGGRGHSAPESGTRAPPVADRPAPLSREGLARLSSATEQQEGWGRAAVGTRVCACVRVATLACVRDCLHIYVRRFECAPWASVSPVPQ